MTRPVVIIEAGASLGSVVAMMKNRHIRHLPVVGADGSLIVTDRDLRQVVFDPSIQDKSAKQVLRKARPAVMLIRPAA
jgi:predicted transcriptional regulator